MKKMLFNTAILLFLISLSSFVNYDEIKIQNTYKIIQEDSKYQLEFCKKALNEANWCGFRYKDKRNVIQFETGLKVELFSQNEIGENNPNCTLKDYRDFSDDVWKFTPNGKIVHLQPIQNKTK